MYPVTPIVLLTDIDLDKSTVQRHNRFDSGLITLELGSDNKLWQ